MTNDKYKISLGPISCFKKVGSLTAFRLMIIFDLALWLCNIYSLWLITDLWLDSIILQLTSTIFCEICMIWAIWLDVKKISLIKKGNFSEKVKKFVVLRRLFFCFMGSLYFIGLLVYTGALMLAHGEKADRWRKRFEFIVKVADLNLVHGLGVFVFFLQIIAFLFLGYWFIDKLERSANLIVVEKEDDIIRGDEKDNSWMMDG